MIRAYLTFLGAALTVLTTPAATAQSHEEAKAEGKAFAEDAREKAKAAATTAADPDTLPNYDLDAARDLQNMADDPAGIEAAARSNAPGHQGYRARKDSLTNRARFERTDIEAVIARAGAVSDNPLDFTSGMAIGGSHGTCVPLPPSPGTAGTYIATCNTGYTAEQEQLACTVLLEGTVTQQPTYQYLCSDFGEFNFDRVPWCERFSSSDCRVTGYREGRCLRWGKIGNERWCSEPGDIITELTCSAPVQGETPYNISGESIVSTQRNES
ncbi:MAG: conjugal transfer protein TraN, partial [Psychroserpens sp.]